MWRVYVEPYKTEQKIILLISKTLLITITCAHVMGKLYLNSRVQSGLQTVVSQPPFPHWMVEALG